MSRDKVKTLPQLETRIRSNDSFNLLQKAYIIEVAGLAFQIGRLAGIADMEAIIKKAGA